MEPSIFNFQPATALATEWLAKSYYLQSQSQGPTALEDALAAAGKANEISPHFAFAWARLAELELRDFP